MRTALMVASLIAVAEIAPPLVAEPPKFDLSKDKVLYCVGYAHLDTQWRWDFPTTIDQYIKSTMEDNFTRFEQFPAYVFNFTGSVRYEMMKEYYPEHYERLKQYIAQGRWFVSGSSVDEGDANVPSPESIIRQVLYGNGFFRREFGKESVDFMLPDCFGFPASMPSIWAHCGLKGFSTQKLTWGSAVGVPFKIGVWEGLDGASVMAALDPGPYVGAIKGRVDLNPEWIRRIEENGRQYGVFADYHYYGVGDQGGAPKEEDVRNYVASQNNPDGQIKVELTASDQMYKDIPDELRSRLPRYRGDLLLTEHSAGTLTSQSYMKRWNRKGECLADAAERAAVAAHWLGGAQYPSEKLERSWVRLLANQMHDILPGTSIPRAYTYSWNDEIIALNGFAAVLDDSVGAISRALETRVSGLPLVVYNSLAIEREDVIEATIPWSDPAESFQVFDPSGEAVPTQIIKRTNSDARLLFLARTPPLSWSVFDVRASKGSRGSERTPRASETAIENEHYRVTLNADGDVAGIVDKADGDRELLARPARLVFTHERPQSWPAWNMDWADRQHPPIDAVAGPAQVRVVENGPVRAAIEVRREARNSIFIQRISLSQGDAGRSIEFHTDIDWQSTECALKHSFPLTIANPKATYNWGLGTIERKNNEPTKYEVPAHEWFDLTDSSGKYGVSILEDSKYGSDKPSDDELRLTLLYTPGVRNAYLDQHSQDWGRHEMVYAIYGHQSDWRTAKTEWRARRLNLPLRAWVVPKHDGVLGRSFSWASVNTPQVDIRAMKLAEKGSQLIVRLQELWGKPADTVEITFPANILSAEEVDGQERPVAAAKYAGKKLHLSMTPYSPRTFALTLAEPNAALTPPSSFPIELPYNVDVATRDASRADGAIDADGRSIPAEMLPKTIRSEQVEFRLGPTEDGASNAVACRGQEIALPSVNANRLYLLAAAETDLTGVFHVDDHPHELAVQSWTGFVGQWDDRKWDKPFAEVDHICDGKVIGINTGFIKRAPIAWFCTHRHHPTRGNEAYQFSYLFKYGIDLPSQARSLRLPDDPRIKLMAATLARNDNDTARPTAPHYDDFSSRAPITLRHVYPPPPIPVFEGAAPSGAVHAERKPSFADLTIGPPSSSDYVDSASGHTVEFRFIDDKGSLRPHAGSGAKGRSLPRLNDGLVAANDDDTDRCVWYDNEGRFVVDLARNTPLDRINTYSWHRANRAPQYFSLWGAAGDAMPDPLFKHGEKRDWTLIAVVNTKDLGEGGVHASSISATPGSKALGPFRYLLWITQDVGQGTFFTEIDVHVME